MAGDMDTLLACLFKRGFSNDLSKFNELLRPHNCKIVIEGSINLWSLKDIKDPSIPEAELVERLKKAMEEGSLSFEIQLIFEQNTLVNS